MKIQATITLSILLLFTTVGESQLTLDSCINMANSHFEYELQAQSYRSSAELAEKKINTNWYPKFVLDGNATYQNENISIPVDMPGVPSPEVPLNFNRLLVNFNQTIYDGSVTANLKRLEASKYSILEEQIESEKIQLRSKVISIYMSILLTSDKLEIIRSKYKVVNDRLKIMKEGEAYGTIPTINIRSLQAEVLQIDQEIVEVKSTLVSLFSNLSEATGAFIDPTSELIRPNPQVTFDENVEGRPEIQLLTMQIENYELQKGMVGTSRLPKINAFGTVGGGLPGYDIFRDDLAVMALVGIAFKWDIVDYGLAKKERQILSYNQQVTEIQQSRARTQFISELKATELEIVKLTLLLESDQEMIALRKEVSQMKSVQLEEGIVTSTDYLIELNLEEESMLNAKIHELKRILSKLNYLTIQGK